MSRLARHTNTANHSMRTVRTPTPSGIPKRATRCPLSPPSSPKSPCWHANLPHRSSRETWRGSTSTTTTAKTSGARRPKQTLKSGSCVRRGNEQRKSVNTQKPGSASLARRLRPRVRAATRRAKLHGGRARPEAAAKVSQDQATSSHRRGLRLPLVRYMTLRMPRSQAQSSYRRRRLMAVDPGHQAEWRSPYVNHRGQRKMAVQGLPQEQDSELSLVLPETARRRRGASCCTLQKQACAPRLE
jgi:hypothetical protein